ncbi:MAG: hypothetical protein FJX73_10325 [Armatimonadetes bacterium]|nr:hypothetical protein [Armatimonadota bacterium]
MIVTAAVMIVVRSDLAAGIRQQQAVQVFNVAEAGLHYAIARMQALGPASATYTGEAAAVPISTDGTAGGAVGFAAITVRCLDTTIPTGTGCTQNSAYRRIRSEGRLSTPGPTRVVSAIVEGTTSSTSNYAICAYDGVNLDQGVRIYGDVGSNGNITLARGGTPSKVCDSNAGGACPAPVPAPAQGYSGSVYAAGSITCGGGACTSAQIEGTLAPNQPAGSVCPAVTLAPPSSAGASPLTVAAGTTVTLDPSVNYGDVTLASSGTSVCPADVSQRATLIIDSGTDPSATVTVRMRRLWVGKCARLVITGSGRVALWLLEPESNPASAARQALKAEQLSVFGSTTTGATPSAITGDRFTINVLSNKPNGDAGDCLAGDATCGAVHFNQSGLISGTFIVPGGGFELDQAQLTNGAILSYQMQFDQNTDFYWDPASRIGGGGLANFDRLKTWKDQ